MRTIVNPVLRGFNPDPSIIRVGDDYYIAVSTFEWFPGVLIYHSKDLVNWELAARPLNRVSQLNMLGAPSSCGIWAPCLSYDNGIYYLVYTNVRSKGKWKDTPNYLVTAEDIRGEWSEPVYLNSSGFDPSLFHDDDGRKWLVNVLWDHRPWKNPFSGILLQEYSPTEKKLTGPVYNIFKGTELGKTEGPHLYKHNGMYYLITAEGGTGLGHAVTVARSESITGPYEADPENPILTSKPDPTLPLQKSGHASLVETQTGEWYIAHLCARPLPSRGRCILGRETAIQKVVWTDDGWLRLEGGGRLPKTEVPAPETANAGASETGTALVKSIDHFDSSVLNIHFQTLRVPLGEDQLSLTERPGYLRLKGRESLSSLFHQSLVARRQQHFIYTAETCIEFYPKTHQHMAGLICLYDTLNFFYLHKTWDEDAGACINIMICYNGNFSYPLQKPVPIYGGGPVYFRVKVAYDRLRFYYAAEKNQWIPIGAVYDCSNLSDEYYELIGDGRFTGAFVGLCCQDTSGSGLHADFDYFIYKEEEATDL